MKRLVLASAIAASIAVSGCATDPYGYNDPYHAGAARVATGAAIGGAAGAVRRRGHSGRQPGRRARWSAQSSAASPAR